MARIPDSLETRQVPDIVQSDTVVLDLLDGYDHERLVAPKGDAATCVLIYEECRRVIDGMRFGGENELFGAEKDDSFKGSIGNIHQSFGRQDIYPSLHEKAANLLYFVVKNHSFPDGSMLVAATIMIAESKPDEKDTMVKLVMNFLG